MKNALNYKLI